MKLQLSLIIVLFGLYNFCYSNDELNEKQINDLAKSFVEALKGEDFEKCAELWISPGEYSKVFTHWGLSMSLDEIKKRIDKAKENDLKNKAFFTKIIKILEDKKFDLQSLEHTDTKSNISKLEHFTNANNIEIKIKDKAGKIGVIIISYAFSYNSKWYFAGKISRFSSKSALTPNVDYVWSNDALCSKQITISQKEKLQPELEYKLGKKIKINMRFIPSGEFSMGSDIGDEDEKPVLKVKISKHFYISTCEITKRQFATFVRETNYVTEIEKRNFVWGYKNNKFVKIENCNWKTPGFFQELDHPVVNITWNDAKVFTEWLSKKFKQEFRLPSESEWEYVCRAGSKTNFNFGNSTKEMHKFANFPDGSSPFSWRIREQNDNFPYTSPAGSFLPNKWGIFDMHGNVWEWCEDDYSESYKNHHKNEKPQINSPRNKFRILRGGSYISSPKYARSSNRGGNYPNLEKPEEPLSNQIGFRIVRTIQK